MKPHSGLPMHGMQGMPMQAGMPYPGMHGLQQAEARDPSTMDIVQAVKCNNFSRCEALLEAHGSDILQTRDSNGGHTLAHWVAQSGNMKLMKWLADNGAPLEEQSEDSTGMTPIHWAATRGHTEIVHFLLQRGVQINSQDKSGCVPLLIAAQYGHPLLVQYLMQSGADPNILDREDDSALHWAAYKGNVELVSLFLNLGLPLVPQDKFGQNPLHLASMRGNLAAVRILCAFAEEAGLLKSLLGAKDKKNFTPLELAKDKEQNHVAKFLNTLSSTKWVNCIMSAFSEQLEWPFYFVWFQMVLGWSAFYFKLLDCPQVIASGNLLMFGFISNLFMLYFFVKAHITDPGKINTNGSLHKEYTEVVQQLASTGSAAAVMGKTLCHSCRIVRPLRAKHCKVSKLCIDHFDHFCPFIGNAVGSGNYFEFFGYVLFHCFAVGTEIIVAWRWIANCGHSVFVWFILLDSCVFEMMGLGLLGTHIYITAVNLTTNEMSNKGRYAYLRNRNTGRFFNPFDRGIAHNFIERMFFGHTSPELLRQQQEKVELDSALRAVM